MRFRFGLMTGFATGYYLGAKAGRQRYDQMNRQLAKLRRSDALEHVAERAKTVVEEKVEKARSLVETRAGNGHGYGPQDDAGIILPGEAAETDPPSGLGGYSSSR